MPFRIQRKDRSKAHTSTQRHPGPKNLLLRIDLRHDFYRSGFHDWGDMKYLFQHPTSFELHTIIHFNLSYQLLPLTSICRLHISRGEVLYIMPSSLLLRSCTCILPVLPLHQSCELSYPSYFPSSLALIPFNRSYTSVTGAAKVNKRSGSHQLLKPLHVHCS